MAGLARIRVPGLSGVDSAAVGVKAGCPSLPCPSLLAVPHGSAALHSRLPLQIYHTATGRIAYSLRDGAGEALPITAIKFRPASSSSKTKNVLLAVGAWPKAAGGAVCCVYACFVGCGPATVV